MQQNNQQNQIYLSKTNQTMNYSSNFIQELHQSRFDHFRINYDLLFRVIIAKENQEQKPKETPKMKAIKKS